MASLKIPRRANWSTAEISVLVEGVTANYGLAFGKFAEGITSKTKDGFWFDLAEKVKSVSGVERSTDELMKKWRDLKSQTKKREQSRRKEMGMTGGGGEVPQLKEWEEKIVVVIPDELISGIQGGVEAHHSTSKTEKVETVQTKIGDETLVHPVNVEIEVIKDEDHQTVSDEVRVRKRRTQSDLINAQCGYFEQQMEVAETQKQYYIQRTRTEAIREEYFKAALDALEKGQTLVDTALNEF